MAACQSVSEQYVCVCVQLYLLFDGGAHRCGALPKRQHLDKQTVERGGEILKRNPDIVTLISI